MKTTSKWMVLVMVAAAAAAAACAKKTRQEAPAASPVVAAKPVAEASPVAPSPAPALAAPTTAPGGDIAPAAGQEPVPAKLCAGDCAEPANRIERPAYEKLCFAALGAVKACVKDAAFKQATKGDSGFDKSLVKGSLDYPCREMAHDHYLPVREDEDRYQMVTYTDDLSAHDLGLLAAAPAGDCKALGEIAAKLTWPQEHGD